MRRETSFRTALLGVLTAIVLLGPAGWLPFALPERHDCSEADSESSEPCALCVWAAHAAMEPALDAPRPESLEVAVAPPVPAPARPAAVAPRHAFFRRGPPTLS